MGNKKITYLLGAGASCNAVPLVTKIPIALNDFVKYVKEYDKKHQIKSVESFSEAENMINSINEIASKCEKATIDQFIKNEFNDNWAEPKYIKLKNILACLLTFEQLEKNNLLNIVEENYCKVLDDRYVDFIKKITKPNTKIQDYINIISWNYDIQIELAIKNSFEVYSNFSFGEFLENYKIFHYINEPISENSGSNRSCKNFIKLNGSATFSSFQGLTLDYKGYNNDMHKLFVTCLNDKPNDLSSNIKFAWEKYNDTYADISRKNAKFIVEQSDIVIAIGYSFPDTNKDVDAEIFKNFKGKLIIQNAENSRNEIEEKVKAITSAEIDYCCDLDSFYTYNC